MQRLGRGVPVAGVIAVAASLVFFSGMALATPAKTVAKSAAKPAVKTAVQPPPDVVLRHMLSGQAQDTLASLVMRFNEEQKGRIRVVVQNMDALDDVERRRLPSMALLEPDDSMLFFRDKPKFKPLYQVMTTSGQKLEAGQFFPLVADAVDDGAGRIQALPLGLSLPVLMWNKDELRKAGLDPEEPPQSWFDVQTRAGKLYDEGSACPLTSSRFSWIHLENVSTQHGEPLLTATRAAPCGRASTAWWISSIWRCCRAGTRRAISSISVPGSEADHRFLSGECAMITGESALYREARRAGIAVGMSPIPFYDDMHGANRERILPGGMGLWALAGRSTHEYQGVAQFVRFMLRPEVQNEWLRGTGFLPMTPAAMRTLESLDVPPPLVNLATRRLGEASPAKLRTKHNAGLSQLRSIVNEEVTDVWANRKPAKEALDIAMRRAGSGAQ